MVLASSASLLKGVLGSLTGFTRWQRQYSDLAQPPAGVAHVPPGENQLPTPKKNTKAATSRSRSCQHAPPEVKQTANRDSTRRLEPSVTFYLLILHLLISNFNITSSFSSVSCGTLVLTQRVIWLMFNGVMLALLTSSTQLSRVLAPNSWAANGQLTNLNHRLGRVCWPNFTCKLVCLFFRLQIAGGEPEVSKSQCMWPQRSV